MANPQIGDIGTKIRYNAQESLADQTTLNLKYKKPNGNTGEWTATVYNDIYAEYTTLLVTDLDMVGTWSVQIYIETPTWQGHSEMKTFKVEPNIVVST